MSRVWIVLVSNLFDIAIDLCSLAVVFDFKRNRFFQRYGIQAKFNL